jgi:hypothetical protein
MDWSDWIAIAVCVALILLPASHDPAIRLKERTDDFIRRIRRWVAK